MLEETVLACKTIREGLILQKTKYIGFIFFFEKWPPKQHELDLAIRKATKKLGYEPKTCLLHPNMPKIEFTGAEIEVIHTYKCPKKVAWIGLSMKEYGKAVLPFE